MKEVLDRLGIAEVNPGAWAGAALPEGDGEIVASTNPTTGETLASVRLANTAAYEQVVAAAQEAFERWRMLPAPKR